MKYFILERKNGETFEFLCCFKKNWEEEIFNDGAKLLDSLNEFKKN